MRRKLLAFFYGKHRLERVENYDVDKDNDDNNNGGGDVIDDKRRITICLLK